MKVQNLLVICIMNNNIVLYTAIETSATALSHSISNSTLPQVLFTYDITAGNVQILPLRTCVWSLWKTRVTLVTVTSVATVVDQIFHVSREPCYRGIVRATLHGRRTTPAAGGSCLCRGDLAAGVLWEPHCSGGGRLLQQAEALLSTTHRLTEAGIKLCHR